MFALIGWIGRFLLILFVVRLVLRMFTPSGPSASRGGPAPGGPRPRGPFGGGPFAGRPPQTERVGGQLVRCSQCGTYVPETTAITASRGGDLLKFCSDACRQAYDTAHP